MHEQQIFIQNKKLQEYAFATSHIIRAPLANILGLTSIIDVEKIENRDTRQIVEYIQQSATHLDIAIREVVSQNPTLENERAICRR